LYGKRLSCLGNIMNTQQLASLHHRRHGKTKRAGEPVIRPLTRRKGGD
jgi:hypothetical protein